MKIAVLGGGPAGYVSALTARKLGAEVVLIEKEEIGGTCLNKGCIPTKAFIETLELHKYADVRPIDLLSLIQKKDSVVETQKKGLQMLLKEAKVQIIKSEADLVSPKKIVLKESHEVINADRVIIATGSRPSEISIFSFDGKRVLSSDDLWNLKTIPESVTIIGGGAIGCEFAWIFYLLGTKVSIVELMPRILPMEDEEISRTLERVFKKLKIELHTASEVKELKVTDESVEITLSNGKKIVSQYVLVSIGRAYNTENLKSSEIILGNKKEVVVNEKMETSVNDIYAAGDVVGKWLLAHVAYREGEVAAKNALGFNEKMDYSVIPATVFTAIEVASVGLRQQQAAEQGINLKIGVFPFRANAKAHILGQIDGFVKLLVDADSDTIIGAHIIGPRASELIHEVALALKLKAKAKDLKDLIHSHPTLSEATGEAFKDVFGEAIHKISK